VNDILTEAGRKISGTGAAEIDDHAVLVGNLIADFDYGTMVRVLRVPDAKFRDKVFKSLRENLTTLHRELGQTPSWQTMVDTLARNFGSVLGPLTPTELPDSVKEKVAELAQTHTTEEWLLAPRRRFREDRKVKIAEGVEVVQRVHKAPGGLIRGTVETQHGKIVAVGLSGDFFFYPADKLADMERALVGIKMAELPHVLEEYYRTNAIESPGLTPEDLAVALGAASAR
jgi:lipoate-protein ligase A